MKSKFIYTVLMMGLVFSGSSIFATTMNIDTKASTISWTGKKITGDKHTGKISLKKGMVEFKKNMPTKGEFVIDMNSIVNEDLTDEKYNKKLVGHLKSDDFFNATNFPTAKLVVKSFKPVKGTTDQYTVTGDLTIRNKTNPITFPATIKKSGETYTATANVTFDRTKYDVKYNSKKFFDVKKLGDKLILDEIALDLSLKTMAMKPKKSSM